MNNISNLLREVAANPKADAISYLKARMVEAADEIDRLSTIAATDIPVPLNADMAHGMVCLGMAYLKECAPERLRTPAAPVVAEGLTMDVPHEHTEDEDCNCEAVGYAKGWNAALAAHPVAGSPAEAEPDRRRCKECNATRGGTHCWKCGSETFEPHPSCGDDPRLPPIERIRELAKEVGYAIGVHGSLQRDLDVIAAPWRDGAAGNHALLEHIAAGLATDNGPAHILAVERKPLGRYAATIQMDGWYKQLDISVCPNAVYEMVKPAAAEPMPASEAASRLHAAIMNIPSHPMADYVACPTAYFKGHEDARHAAAELVSTHFAAPAAPTDAKPDQIRRALQIAMAICDSVPTRLHNSEDETFARIGRLVNAQPDGSHGYAVIRDALAAYTSQADIPHNAAIGANGVTYHGIEEIYHRMEEGEALHMWLDDHKVPRADASEIVYSLVGRVQQYANPAAQSVRDAAQPTIPETLPLNESDLLRLDWCAQTLRVIADGGRAKLGDAYPEIVAVLGAIETVMQPSLYEPTQPTIAPEDVRDAQRYRWLRDKHDGGDEQWFVYGAYGPLDKAIDAEMAAAAVPGEAR